MISDMVDLRLTFKHYNTDL